MAKAPTPKKINASSQQYLPITAIKEGAVIMTDHSLRAVILVSSLNFALKSEEEKQAVIISYQDFLNSLQFPVQFLATSKRLDISNYLISVQKASENQRNPLLKLQAEEYVSFVKQLLESANIMEKRFYIIVPFYPAGVEQVPGVASLLKKKKDSPITTSFEEQKAKLAERAERMIGGLTSLGLRAAVLSTEDLLELYYSSYNPDSAQKQNVGMVNDVDAQIISGEQK